jgi:uncharacterized protein with GYD domain
MPMYVVLYNWTEKGIQHVKDSPTRAESYIKAVEDAGGKITGLWYTLGAYDMVGVVDWEDEKAATAFLLTQSTHGFVRTTTLLAHSREQFAEITKLMP